MKQFSLISEFKSFEFVSGTTVIDKDILNVVNIYRPPYNSKTHPYTTQMFINEFEMFLLNLSDFKGKLILTGDFNINYFQKDNTLASFNNLLSNYNLQQLVTKSTTIHNSILDLIIIEDTLMKNLLSITLSIYLVH